MEKKEFFQYDSEAVEEFQHPLGTIHHFTFSSPHEEGRKNQDSSAYLSVSDDLCFLIVADGMGGYKGGGKASQIAVETMIKRLSKVKPSDTSGAIISAIDEAHQNIKDTKNGSGTTISITEIQKEFFRFYTLGDSTCYYFNSTGDLAQHTVDHSPVGYGLESGFLKEEESIDHEQGHILLNALGKDPYFIDVSCPTKWAQKAHLVMGSDGLTANVEKETLKNIIAASNASQATGELVTYARTKMGDPKAAHRNPDDYTCILFQFAQKES